MTFILAYWPALSIVLILMLFGVFFFAPGWAGVATGIVFSLSMAMTILSVLQKHRNLYREKPLSKIKLACAVLFEMMGIWTAMILAGLSARTSAQILTQQISDDQIRFAAGITTGLLVGIGVGLLMQSAWGRLIKISAEN